MKQAEFVLAVEDQPKLATVHARLASKPSLFMGVIVGFWPNQIVCLESNPSLLFGEVIEHVTTRKQCWVRPLVLAIAADAAAHIESIATTGWDWYDLRDGSDLLLPEQLFRAALDMEVLPLMSLLYQAESKSTDGQQQRSQTARQQLHQFIRQLCQSQPQVFQN